ncbi:MAG: murein biosynthesis integral membrane protein MurJ [Alphaproteobacteria bacterium]|nr:murein biosynthesis integral membrane protein MurJ [Alphaproteobacteria bacterium]
MSLLRSIATVGGFTMLSRLIGFGRDVLVAAFLGATMYADAFFVAFRFPNLFRSLFAEGTLNVSFVPLFTENLKKKGEKQAENFASEAFSFLFYVLLIFVVLMELAMPFATIVLAPGFDSIPGKIEATSYLSRITFPFLLFVSLVSLLAGVLNSVGRFAAAAFTPCILNLVMIYSLLWGTSFVDNPAVALSWGVFLAGAVELIFIYYCVKKAGFSVRLFSPFKTFLKISAELKKLFKRMLPGVLGSGVYQINLFLDTFFVSFVGAGAMSWLNYAHHLFQLPIGIIGVAIGTVLLPVLSRYVAEGKIKQAVHDLNRGLEVSLAMSVSSMIGLIILARPIVTVLFQRGAFTADSTLPTATALQAFAIGLPAYMLTKALAPFFYARGDTKTPVRIAVVGVIINAILCLSLMQIWGHVGIAMATGITVWVNAGQYIYLLRKQGDFSLDSLFKYRFIRIIGSALMMGLLLFVGDYIYTNIWGNWANLGVFFSLMLLIFLIGAAAVVYFAVLILTHGILIKDVKEFLLSKRKRRNA